MATNNHADQVRGKTIRLSWNDGPIKMNSQVHVFHDDGTVEWRALGDNGNSLNDGAATADARIAPLRPRYAGVKITDDVCMVSYLLPPGYALTVALNFGDGSAVAIASNAKNWLPARGRFEVAT